MAEKKILVLYHKDCKDGFTAAWLYRKYRMEVLNSAIETVFYPVAYGNPLVFESSLFWETVRVETRFCGLVLLDFSYPRETMELLARRVEKGDWDFFACYDHHASAEKDCEGIPGCVFTRTRCGAGLIWDQFFMGETPSLVQYVEDHDLYKFDLPHSRAIRHYIDLADFTWDSWDALANILEHQFPEAVKVGELMARSHAQAITRHLEQTILARIGPYDNIPLVNCSDKKLISDLGHELCKGMPFSVSFRFIPENKKPWVFSLRSDANGVDVFKIAKEYGGGGHKHAAGFALNSLTEIGLS